MSAYGKNVALSESLVHIELRYEETYFKLFRLSGLFRTKESNILHETTVDVWICFKHQYDYPTFRTGGYSPIFESLLFTSTLMVGVSPSGILVKVVILFQYFYFGVRCSIRKRPAQLIYSVFPPTGTRTHDSSFAAELKHFTIL
tara:strand:- start:60 stop:491 length:432 start_codon:yes stop_codon:yes gene_type:complete